MKEQIKKLIELADAYATFGVEINLPMSFTVIRGTNAANMDWCKRDGIKTTVYLSNRGDVWSVIFDNVEISGYNKRIMLPFDVTEEYLDGLYESAKSYLYDYLFPDVAKCKIATLKEKHNEIKALEDKLRKLKGLY
jgi:hypothetical protein